MTVEFWRDSAGQLLAASPALPPAAIWVVRCVRVWLVSVIMQRMQRCRPRAPVLPALRPAIAPLRRVCSSFMHTDACMLAASAG